jgi:hypothetical protein
MSAGALILFRVHLLIPTTIKRDCNFANGYNPVEAVLL